MMYQKQIEYLKKRVSEITSQGYRKIQVKYPLAEPNPFTHKKFVEDFKAGKLKLNKTVTGRASPAMPLKSVFDLSEYHSNTQYDIEAQREATNKLRIQSTAVLDVLILGESDDALDLLQKLSATVDNL